jgi:Ras-related protein Rab-5C/Rab family protein
MQVLRASDLGLPASTSNASLETITIVVGGPIAAGKTSLVQRWTTGAIQPNTPSTLGSEATEIRSVVEQTSVTLRFIDLPGHERLRSVCYRTYKNADVVVIAYPAHDSTSWSSLDTL